MVKRSRPDFRVELSNTKVWYPRPRFWGHIWRSRFHFRITWSNTLEWRMWPNARAKYGVRFRCSPLRFYNVTYTTAGIQVFIIVSMIIILLIIFTCKCFNLSFIASKKTPNRSRLKILLIIFAFQSFSVSIILFKIIG